MTLILNSFTHVSQNPYAVNNNKLVVFGKCYLEKGNYEGQKIVLTKDTIIIKELFESKKFSFNLDLDNQYVITFSKPNYITKQFSINTMFIPETRKKESFEPFEFSTTLQTQSDSEIVTFPQPVGLIKYNKELEDFDYKTNYNKRVIKK